MVHILYFQVKWIKFKKVLQWHIENERAFWQKKIQNPIVEIKVQNIARSTSCFKKSLIVAPANDIHNPRFILRITLNRYY